MILALLGLAQAADASSTQYFGVSSAIPLDAGAGYASQEVMVSHGEYGLTDNWSIRANTIGLVANGGLGFRYGRELLPGVYAGAWIDTWGMLGFYGIVSMGGHVTLGNPRWNVTLGTTGLILRDYYGGGWEPFYDVHLALRLDLGERVAFISENHHSGPRMASMSINGVRVHMKRWSLDLGAAALYLEHEGWNRYPVPYAGFTVYFRTPPPYG